MTGSAPPIRAVLFDAFGTLITLHKPVRTLVAALDAVGAANPPSAVASAFLTEVAYYRRKQDTGRDAASLAALRRQCAEVFCSTLPNPPSVADATRVLVDSLPYQAYDDVIPAMARLRSAGILIAVVSNFDVSLGEVLQDTGLAPYIDVTVASAVVGARKPDPAIFQVALDGLGVPASAAIHCGDRRDEDGEGALAAGIRPVLIRRDEDAEGDADTGFTVVSDLRRVVDLALGDSDTLAAVGGSVSPSE